MDKKKHHPDDHHNIEGYSCCGGTTTITTSSPSSAVTMRTSPATSSSSLLLSNKEGSKMNQQEREEEEEGEEGGGWSMMMSEGPETAASSSPSVRKPRDDEDDPSSSSSSSPYHHHQQQPKQQRWTRRRKALVAAIVSLPLALFLIGFVVYLLEVRFTTGPTVEIPDFRVVGISADQEGHTNVHISLKFQVVNRSKKQILMHSGGYVNLYYPATTTDHHDAYLMRVNIHGDELNPYGKMAQDMHLVVPQLDQVPDGLGNQLIRECLSKVDSRLAFRGTLPCGYPFGLIIVPVQGLLPLPMEATAPSTPGASAPPSSSSTSQFANAQFNFTPPGGGSGVKFTPPPPVASAGQDDEEGDDDDSPEEVKRRIQFLRALQDKRDEMMTEYRKERIALENKYHDLFNGLYDIRGNIVAARSDVQVGADGSLKEGPPFGEEGKGKISGIPNFWMRSLFHHEILHEVINEQDAECLAYLSDIKVTETKEQDGFKIEFFFNPNPFFTNAVLSKSYDVPNMLDGTEPILRSNEGTNIDWKPGKNLCVEEKRVKNKGRRGGTTVKKVEKDSFFNFFKTQEIPEDEDNDDYDEMVNIIEFDYSLALAIKNELVPNAIKFYLGEVDIDDDDEEEDEDDDDDDDDNDHHGHGEDDEDDDDDDDDDDDEDDRPVRAKPPKAVAPVVAGVPGAPPGDNPECKQS